jgi:flagellar basal-body rod modification protein FlgD
MSHTIPMGIVTHLHAASSSAAAGSGSSGSSSDASSASSTASGLAALPANEQISQTGFLQLISTQMQNQDPLNPTDPTQFLAQIEGLSEVSSLQSLQTSISGLASGLQASQVISGTSLLGHSVLAPGTTANIAAGGTVNGAVTAPAGASSLAVSVTSAAGALVDSFSVSPQASGYTPITWNGTTSTGASAPAGQYTIQVNAQVGNASQSVSPLLYSQVTSVTIDPSTQALDLNTNNGTIPLSSVVNIQ